MTGERTFGLTPGDLADQLRHLGDDQPGERLDYDLGHALAGWADATAAHLGDQYPTAADLTTRTRSGTRDLQISGPQADRLTRMLNVDTGLLTAHRAATRKD